MSDRSAYWKEYYHRRKREDPKFIEATRGRAASYREEIKKLKAELKARKDQEFPLLTGFREATDKKAFIRKATAYWRNAE